MAGVSEEKLNSKTFRDNESSTWLLGSWDADILRLLLAWRKPEVFRPSFKIEMAKRINDPEAGQLRHRAALKDGTVKPGETRLNHRVNTVIAHLVHAGLASRTRDTVKIVDRAGIQAILDAGQVTYPRRGSNEEQ